MHTTQQNNLNTDLRRVKESPSSCTASHPLRDIHFGSDAATFSQLVNRRYRQHDDILAGRIITHKREQQMSKGDLRDIPAPAD